MEVILRRHLAAQDREVVPVVAGMINDVIREGLQ